MKENVLKKITRFNNEVNTIPMRDWSTEEMNFFFSVLTRMRDEGTSSIVMDKYELAELARYTIEHNKRYHDTIESLTKKLQDMTYFKKTSNSFVMMPLFTYFEATWSNDLSDMSLEVDVNKRFEYILNEWNEGNWTQFMLDEFLEVKSTYSKTLFRLLKQYKTVGKREFNVEEFKTLMNIPKSYSTGMITTRIVENGIRDLQPYFLNLKVKKIKSNKRGTPVIGYEFTFKPEKTEKWQEDKYTKQNIFKKPSLKTIEPKWFKNETSKVQTDTQKTEKNEDIKNSIQRFRNH